MKRLAAAALLVAGLAVPVTAQTPAAPGVAAPAVKPTGSTRIAVIAFQEAVGRTNEFQRAVLDLQKKWNPKQQQLQTQGADLDAQTKQLQAQAANLSETEAASRTKALEDKRKNFERAFEDARNDYQQEVQTLYNNIATKVFDVMANYAEKNGFTLVLDEGSQEKPIVLYAIDTTDITQAVIDGYNVKSGVSAPPQQPANVPGTPGAARPGVSKPAPAATKPPTPKN